MNASTNHGCIAWNGFLTFDESYNAIMKIYGVSTYDLDRFSHVYVAGLDDLKNRLSKGYDLASLLTTFGAAQAGDGDHHSIGVPPGKPLPVEGGLVSQPHRISNAHNRFEGDASPAREDLYQLWAARSGIFLYASFAYPSLQWRSMLSHECPPLKVVRSSRGRNYGRRLAWELLCNFYKLPFHCTLIYGSST